MIETAEAPKIATENPECLVIGIMRANGIVEPTCMFIRYDTDTLKDIEKDRDNESLMSGYLKTALDNILRKYPANAPVANDLSDNQRLRLMVWSADNDV